MTTSNRVNLDKLMEEFAHLEQTITDFNEKKQVLEINLNDADRQIKFYKTKEQSLTEERDTLLLTVKSLQESLEKQCSLRAENDKLRKDVVELRLQNAKTAEDGEVEVQRLLCEIATEADRHKRELQAVREQGKREAELAQREAVNQIEAKEAEAKKLLEEKDLDLEEMRRKLRDQERERQSEILKLQMEFGAKLARVQDSAQWRKQQQQQTQASGLRPHNIFKRKLHFIQEEKNREIEVLRQRIKELEENQHSDGRMKRRKF